MLNMEKGRPERYSDGHLQVGERPRFRKRLNFQYRTYRTPEIGGVDRSYRKKILIQPKKEPCKPLLYAL